MKYFRWTKIISDGWQSCFKSRGFVSDISIASDVFGRMDDHKIKLGERGEFNILIRVVHYFLKYLFHNVFQINIFQELIK